MTSQALKEDRMADKDKEYLSKQLWKEVVIDRILSDIR